MADDEDGKPETRVSRKDIAVLWVTFVEITIVVVDVLLMLDGVVKWKRRWYNVYRMGQ